MYGESIGDMFYNVRAVFDQAEQDIKRFQESSNAKAIMIRIGIDLKAIESDVKKIDQLIGTTRTIKITLDTSAVDATMRNLESRMGGKFGAGNYTSQAAVLQTTAPNIMGTSNGDVSLGPGQFLTNPVSPAAVMANAMYRATPISPTSAAPAATVNPDLMAWSQNPVMQAAYKGNPDVVGRQLAERLGVSVDDVQSAMGGGMGAARSVTTAASPLSVSRAMSGPSYSTDRIGGDEEDVRRYRSSTAAAFAPLGPDQGRRSVFSHNDSLINALNLDALDESIPTQMKTTRDALKRDSREASFLQSYTAHGASKRFNASDDALVNSYGLDSLDESIPRQMRGTSEGLKRDSAAAALRESRMVKRDALQMQHDMDVLPLSDRELSEEQIDRMGGPTLPAEGAGGGRKSIWTRRLGLNGMRATAAGLAVLGGIGAFDAWHGGMVNERIAGQDQSAAAVAAMNSAQEIGSSVAFLGSAAFSITNASGMLASGNSKGWMGGNIANIQETLADAQKQENLNQIMRQGLQSRQGNNFSIEALQAHQDPFTQQAIANRAEFEKAKIDATDVRDAMVKNGAESAVADAEVTRRMQSAKSVFDAKNLLNSQQSGLATGTITSAARAIQMGSEGNSLGSALEQFSDENLQAELAGSPPEARAAIMQKYLSGAAGIRRNFIQGTGDIQQTTRSIGMRSQGLAFEADVTDLRASRDRELRDIDPNASQENSDRYKAVSAQYGAQERQLVNQEWSRRALFGVQNFRIDSSSAVMDMQRKHQYASANLHSILSDAGASIEELNDTIMRPEERQSRITAIQNNTRARLGLFSQELQDRFEQGNGEQVGAGITLGDRRSKKDIESFMDDARVLKRLQSGEDMVGGLDGGVLIKDQKGLGSTAAAGGTGEVSLREGHEILTALQAIQKNTEGGPRAT